MSDHTIILIPARIGSTRLPRKPLLDICGLPMILHVVNRAHQANIGRVVVATDDQEIFSLLQDHQQEVILTTADHPSGSDRIYEALQKIDPLKHYEFIINLQGDLPTIAAQDIQKVLSLLQKYPCDIATLASQITQDDEKTNPNIVKMIGSPLNITQATPLQAHYFTRATAPWGEGPLYHHIGIYGYRRHALEQFIALPPAQLEQREKLEQLRAIAHNMRLYVELIDSVPLGVDTNEELEKARQILQEN